MDFQVGDQVVHSVHGVGEITDIGVKKFGKREPRSYYEILTPQLTVWVPIDAKRDEPRLRKLTSAEKLPQLRQILQSKPKKLQKNYRSRQAQIRTRLQGGKLKNLVEVVRDLTALSRERPLNGSDEQQLTRATRMLAREWGEIKGWKFERAEGEIQQMLTEAHRNRQNASEGKMQVSGAFAD
ncbi:MAG TPA: CarD family transcriptional regulator [Anaerolineales bacterium]|nr:CarD family transcriptional regulator [Anaerolineales bacterium]